MSGALIALHSDLASGSDLTDARRLFLTGKYAEAAAVYEKLRESAPVEAALGEARCDVATGKHENAIRLLNTARAEQAKDARISAELAALYFEFGNYDAAASQADAALKLDSDERLARWIQAELLRTSGKLEEAEAGYKWFVDYYNEQEEIKDPDKLRLIGLAAAQHARWNRAADQYSFLVNELYPDILKLDKDYWPAHYEAGLLFLEKFNQADATKEFGKALAINPNAAEVHAAVAAMALQNYELPQAERAIERALANNPELLWAKQLQADVQLSNFDAAAAIETLGEALKLNPRDERTLGRLAAAYVARDGVDSRSIASVLGGERSVGNARSLPAVAGGVPEPPSGVDSSSRPTERHRGRSLQTTGPAIDDAARTKVRPSVGESARSGDLRRTEVGESARSGDLRRTEGGSLQTLIAEVNARNAHAGEFYNAAGDALDKLRRYPAARQFYTQAIERMPQLVAPYGQLGLIQMRLADEAAAEKTLKKAFAIDPFNVRVSNTIKVLEILSTYATIETDHFVIKFDRGHDEVLARSAAKYLEDDVYPTLVKRLGYEPEGKSLFEFFSRAKNTDGHGWFSARMVGLPYVGTVGACAGRVVAMQSPSEAREPFNWARVLRHEFVHVVNLQQTDFNIPHWFTEALAVYNEDMARPAVWEKLLADAVKNDKLFTLETINGGFARPKSGSDWNLAYCQADQYARYMVARFGDDALAKMLKAYANNLTTRQAIERSFAVEQDEFERGYNEHVKKVADGITAESEAQKRSLAELRDSARQYLLSGENEKLAGALARLAAADADSLTVRKKLAILAFERKDWPEAARWAGEAVHIDVNDAQMHQIAGAAAAAQNQHADAIHSYRLAVRLDERDIPARQGLVRAYVAAEQVDKARVELEALKKVAPNTPVVRELEVLIDQ